MVIKSMIMTSYRIINSDWAHKSIVRAWNVLSFSLGFSNIQQLELDMVS